MAGAVWTEWPGGDSLLLIFFLQVPLTCFHLMGRFSSCSFLSSCLGVCDLGGLLTHPCLWDIVWPVLTCERQCSLTKVSDFSFEVSSLVSGGACGGGQGVWSLGVGQACPFLSADLSDRSDVHPTPSTSVECIPPSTPSHQGTRIWFPHSSSAQDNRNATPSPLRMWPIGRVTRKGVVLAAGAGRGWLAFLLPAPRLLLQPALWAGGACRAAGQWAS